MCIHGWLILQSTHEGIKESIHFFPRHSGRMFWQIEMTWQLWTIYLGQWQRSDYESKIMRKILSTLSLDCNLLLVYSWNGSHNHLISLSYLYLPFSYNFLSFLSSFIYCDHPSCPFCIISSNKPSPSQIEYWRKILKVLTHLSESPTNWKLWSGLKKFLMQYFFLIPFVWIYLGFCFLCVASTFYLQF